MGSHGEHSEEKAHRLTKTVNESDVDIAAFAASSESDEPLNPQVAVRLRFVQTAE
jgi:hypothetical protein